MLIINVKDSENIEKALKRYRRKYQRVGVLKQIRNRREFTKPSVQRRNEILKAQHRLKKIEDMESEN